MNSTFSFKTIIKDEFDRVKQRNAIMPNLIHSLDASSIALLNEFLSKNTDRVDIYTIHDCFAVTANNIDTWIKQLKNVYLYIYTGHEYLINLDTHIKNTIENYFGRDKFSEDYKYVYINDGEKILYPSIKRLLDNNICIKGLKDSANIIT